MDSARAQASAASRRMEHIRHRAQFQWVLAGPPVVKTAHFALHLAALDTSGALQAQPEVPARPLFPHLAAWVGTLVPKRWARRAVTRNLMRRQIYAVAAETLAGLPDAALVVRLRSGFDRQQFRSAASDPLKAAVRAELQQLFERLAHRRPAGTRHG